MNSSSGLILGDSSSLWSDTDLGDLDEKSGSGPALSRLDALRRSAFRGFLSAGWVITAFTIIFALAYTASVWWVTFASAACNFVAGWLVKTGPSTARLRTAVVLLVSSQPLFFLVSLRLSGFEALTPLAVFVALMALTTFCDRKVVYASTLVTFVTLTTLDLMKPDWLFVGKTIQRDLLYAAELLIVSAVAAVIAGNLRELVEQLEDAERDSSARANELHHQAGDLEKALGRAETERQERERVEAAQEEARKLQINAIVQDFEASISVVTHSISETAALLESTTKTLSVIAHDTGQGAVDVSDGAATASHAARMVAKGVSELSSSITEIASDVGQQNALATEAIDRSNSGGEAVGGLSNHSDTIGEATRAIVRIAERTNLLSLNAAIEAASAGPAGRGFTIVAQEVKALAMQASEAATQIDSFLKGVRTGTHEAERSFQAIDSVISSLAETSTAIRWEVDRQRKSADAIEDYARNAAEDVGAMATRSEKLAGTAKAAEKLSNQLDDAAAQMLADVLDLQRSTAQFVSNLKEG